jgi:sigma-70-like protein
MALSEDQRALLRLLVGGESYEHVAELLGTTPADVRSRAHQAASSLEDDSGDDLPAERVRDTLDALDHPDAASHPAAHAAEPRRDFRRWALWAAVAAAIALAVVVVAVAGGGGGGDESSQTVTGGQEEAVPIRLAPVNGSRASGNITIIRVVDQPAVDLEIRGLEPSRPGETYVLWFVGSGGRSLPVAFRAVGSDGKLSGQAAIPQAAIGLLPSFQIAELGLARQREAAAALKRAAQSGTLPEPVGRIVMRGALRG